MNGRACAVLLWGVLLVTSACAGAERLVVVHDSGRTVPAAPFVELTDLSPARIAEADVRARERLAELEPAPDAGGVIPFPIAAAPLRPGPEERVRVRGLLRAVFAIGADDASRAWLDAHAAELRGRGAVGFLVSVESAGGLRRMRDHAARLGLTLDPLPGTALAEAFGARSYPFVAEPSP